MAILSEKEAFALTWNRQEVSKGFTVFVTSTTHASSTRLWSYFHCCVIGSVLFLADSPEEVW